MAEQDPFAGVASATQSDDPFAGVASATSSKDPFEGVASQVKGSNSIPGSEKYDNNKPVFDRGQFSLEDKVKGLGEAALMLGTGAAAPVFGFVGGTANTVKKALKGDTLDWKKDVEDAAERNTYTPKTEMGMDYAEKMAPALETLQAFGPTGFHVPAFKAMQALDIAAVNRAAKKAGKAEAAATTHETSLGSLKADIESRKAAEAADVRKADAQADMFPQELSQAEQATQGPRQPEVVPPEAGPIRDRRQQQLQLDHPDTLQVTPEGVAIPEGPIADRALYERGKLMDEQIAKLDAEQKAQVAEDRPHNVTNDEHGQGDLFDAGNPTPYTSEGQWHIDENGMPIRSDLSMEAQHMGNPLQRDMWGQENPGGMTHSLDETPHTPFKGDPRDAMLSMLGEPRAMKNFNEGKHGQGGGLYLGEQVRLAEQESPHRWFTASPESGRSRGHSLESQAARPNAEGQRYGPGQYIAQSRDFSSVYGGKEGRMYTVEAPFERPFDVNKASNDKIYQTLVEKTGSRTEANRTLAKAGYDAITFTDPRGNKLANIFNEKPLTDVGPAREELRQQELSLQNYEPGVDPFKSQRGHIKIGESAEGAVDILNKIGFPGARNMVLDRSDPKVFIAKMAGVPDVKQNTYQQLANWGTKGSVYLSERLDNPVYSRVTGTFREANGRAKAQVQQVVHDTYVPTMRALNDAEKVKVAGALNLMDRNNVRLTSDELISHGFNQKERDAIRIHQSTMDNVVPKMNAAMEAVGMSHIDPRAAYVATKMEGAFRKVYLDENNQVVGALGAKTRRDLLAQEAEFLKLHPNAVPGKEMVMGPAASQGSLSDVISYLAAQDPKMAEILGLSQDVAAADALNYRGVKTHTMSKKGIEGMPGNKPWEDPVTNARDLFDSQAKYLTRALEFAEKAKATAEVRPILDSLKVDMPNATKLASDYVDFTLGKNPYKLAQAMDAVVDTFSTAFGGQLNNVLGGIPSGVKRFTNAKLLTLSPGFLFSNVVQQIRNMPEIAAMLNARGITKNTGLLGAESMARVTAMDATGNWTPIMREAMEYAKDNNVYNSDLIDSRKGIAKAGQGDGLREKWNNTADAIEHYAQKPASVIEGDTRKTFFLTTVDLLHKNGVTKEQGLFEIANNMTDRGMNHYSREEAPAFIKAMGSVGQYPYNLLSFKFNELSRFMSNIREAGTTPASLKPMLVSIAMQVAAGGIMGTIGYTEANTLVQMASQLMGSPTSLTKILLENADKKLVGPVTVGDAAYGGLSKATGIDMTNRMGVGPIGGTMSLADQLMPGLSAAGLAAKSIADYAGDRSTWNRNKMVVEAMPGGQNLDRFLFSKNKDTDKEMGISRKTGQAKYIRNDADKMAKDLGMTGVNEAKQSTLGYERSRISKIYDEKQKAAILNMSTSNFADGKIDPKYIKDFTNSEGKAENFTKIVNEMIMDQNTPADVRDQLKVLASKNPMKIARRFH